MDYDIKGMLILAETPKLAEKRKRSGKTLPEARKRPNLSLLFRKASIPSKIFKSWKIGRAFLKRVLIKITPSKSKFDYYSKDRIKL